MSETSCSNTTCFSLLDECKGFRACQKLLAIKYASRYQLAFVYIAKDNFTKPTPNVVRRGPKKYTFLGSFAFLEYTKCKSLVSLHATCFSWWFLTIFHANTPSLSIMLGRNAFIPFLYSCSV